MDDIRYFEKQAHKVGANLFGATNYHGKLALVLGFSCDGYKDLGLIDSKTHDLIRHLQENGHNVSQVKATKNGVSLRRLALDAGLGFIGKSGLLITKKHGPDVRLTGLIVDARVNSINPLNLENICDNCKACIDACPSGALRTMDEKKCTDHVQSMDDQRCTVCIDSCRFKELKWRG